MTYRIVRTGAALAAATLVALGSLVGGAIGATIADSAAGASTRATTTGPDCGPRVMKNLFVSWQCTFSDDFNGSALDTSKWVPVTTASNGVTAGPGCFVDSPQNIAVYGGALHLSARQEAAPFTCSSPKGNFTTQYSAGQVATYDRFFQTYGRFAVRAAFPAATVAGLQSTLWLWPQSPASVGAVGEIDFAEWYSSLPDHIIPYVHYLYLPLTTNRATGSNVVTNNNCVIGDVSTFHEYVAEWTQSSIIVKIDGQTCLTDRYRPFGVNPFNQPYFIALSQALGQGTNAPVPGSTPLPGTTTIDYVRAWK